MPRRVTPFSWESLPFVPHADCTAFSDAMRTLVHYVDHSRFASEVAALLPELHVGSPRLASANAPFPNAVAVRLNTADLLGEAPGVIVEVDAALAVVAISRLLAKREPQLIRARTAPDALAGAWAAVLMRVLRAASKSSPIVAFEAGSAEHVTSAWFAHGLSRRALVGAVTHAGQTYPYRLLIGGHPPIAVEPFGRDDLLSLGKVSLRLPLVGAIGTLGYDELESIRSGDIWLPDTWYVSHNEGKLVGNPLVATPDFSYGWHVTITNRDEISFTSFTEVEMSNEPTAPSKAQTHDSADALIAGLGSAPVSLKLELGSVELTARDWARLSPGAILSTGLPIGARVIIRAGSIAVATGELVNVEGELGVRILERTS